MNVRIFMEIVRFDFDFENKWKRIDFNTFVFVVYALSWFWLAAPNMKSDLNTKHSNIMSNTIRWCEFCLWVHYMGGWLMRRKRSPKVNGFVFSVSISLVFPSNAHTDYNFGKHLFFFGFPIHFFFLCLYRFLFQFLSFPRTFAHISNCFPTTKLFFPYMP